MCTRACMFILLESDSLNYFKYICIYIYSQNMKYETFFVK